jgi:hypothetical protein
MTLLMRRLDSPNATRLQVETGVVPVAGESITQIS